jgi:hypothetical protein
MEANTPFTPLCSARESLACSAIRCVCCEFSFGYSVGALERDLSTSPVYTLLLSAIQQATSQPLHSHSSLNPSSRLMQDSC